jgi:hypothetical protein
MDGTYETRVLVARGPLIYNGLDLRPGDRFRALSEVDAAYLISRGRADESPPEPEPQVRLSRRRRAPIEPTPVPIPEPIPEPIPVPDSTTSAEA